MKRVYFWNSEQWVTLLDRLFRVKFWRAIMETNRGKKEKLIKRKKKKPCKGQGKFGLRWGHRIR